MRDYCLPPIPVSQAELLMFRLRAHLSGMSIACYVRQAGRALGMPQKKKASYCFECHGDTVTETAEIDLTLRTGLTVRGVPARRCSKCGSVFEDIRLGAILETDATFLPPGTVKMGDLLEAAVL